MADINIRRDDSLMCGRLVALPTSATTVLQNSANSSASSLSNTISIDFPAMPDTIELARSVEYNVTPSLVLPDGIHQYKSTRPLEIPVSFRLHSFDKQYCKQGVLTLLQLAARLHSFTLPISTFGAGGITASIANSTVTQVNGGSPNESALLAKAQGGNTSTVSVTGANGGNKGQIYAPVACWLYLIWIADNQPGISAFGYVKDVKVVLNGPWLRGPSGSFNLPSSGDFSFTFMHRPGHGNTQTLVNSQFPSTTTESGQAFADDVRAKLYNTRALVYAGNYQGFASNPSNQTS